MRKLTIRNMTLVDGEANEKGNRQVAAFDVTVLGRIQLIGVPLFERADGSFGVWSPVSLDTPTRLQTGAMIRDAILRDEIAAAARERYLSKVAVETSEDDVDDIAGLQTFLAHAGG